MASAQVTLRRLMKLTSTYTYTGQPAWWRKRETIMVESIAAFPLITASTALTDICAAGEDSLKFSTTAAEDDRLAVSAEARCRSYQADYMSNQKEKRCNSAALLVVTWPSPLTLPTCVHGNQTEFWLPVPSSVHKCHTNLFQWLLLSSTYSHLPVNVRCTVPTQVIYWEEEEKEEESQSATESRKASLQSKKVPTRLPPSPHLLRAPSSSLSSFSFVFSLHHCLNHNRPASSLRRPPERAITNRNYQFKCPPLLQSI